MILVLRTDKPEAEVGLFAADGTKITFKTWYAHRELSATLLTVIKDQLTQQGKDFDDLEGIVVFRGPGSFTGLRIGITVANTLAYSLEIPIVGATGDDWQQDGLRRLKDGEDDSLILPDYGAEAHITKPKK